MPTVSYPLDTTGLASSNLVEDEVHILTPDNANPYRVIIPTFAPFYPDNFSFERIDGNGIHHPLVFGVDYKFIFMYVDATRAIGKALYGGIDFLNNNINGVVSVTYQTIGDKWCADAALVKQALAELLFNPRVAYWDQITNVQETFPPTPHALPMETTTGYQSLLDKIDEVINTIIDNNTATNQFVHHLLREDNPHTVTKQQVGLGLVGNYADATDLEVASLANVQKRFLLSQLPSALTAFTAGAGGGGVVTLDQLTTILADYVQTTGLSNYVTTTDMNTALTDYVSDSELTATLTSYVTTTALNTTLSPINTSISTINNEIGTMQNDMLIASDLIGYVTETQLSDSISNLISDTQLTSILGNYVTDAELAIILADFTPASGTGGGDITETMVIAASFNT